jgi:hypothetical protein
VSSSRGIVTLANDTVLEDLTALLESIAVHEPSLPVVIIPFNDNVSETRALAQRHGHSVFEGPELEAMDRIGGMLWPERGEYSVRCMRKFCTFWTSLETFLFLDADIALLAPVTRYFEAFDASRGDILYFHPDLERVYRPGLLREDFERRLGSVGFNGGIFLARSGALSVEYVEECAAAADSMRPLFSDEADQGLLNFCVDRAGLAKVSAGEAVPDVTAASALMRLVRRHSGLVMKDVRVPESGRPVVLIHWAGYLTGPFMPYRRIFRRYRVGLDAPRRALIAYELRALSRSAARTTPRRAYHALRKARWQIVNDLAARGIVSWPRRPPKRRLRRLITRVAGV